MIKYGEVRIDQLLIAAESGAFGGFCVSCGLAYESLPAPAVGLWCRKCHAYAVYGAEELIHIYRDTENGI